MIQILKQIDEGIGIEMVINFLTLLAGIGIGAGITDALWKGDRRGKKRNGMDRRGDKLSEKKHGQG